MTPDRAELDAIRVLLVPGGGGSGPDHWHTYWEASSDRVERVIQADWDGGTRDQWVSALDRQVRLNDGPVILVAHSLGNIVVCHWAATRGGAVIGALLVAPADVDAEWASGGSLYQKFRPVPMSTLPFPSMLVASTNDPYLSMPRARELASAWGSSVQVVGPIGHIGSDSKLGFWEDGQRLLGQLITQSRRTG